MTGELSTILRELKAGLGAIYGPRLLGLYLFGSQARGDAEEGSDIDVAMVLDHVEPRHDEYERYGDLVWRLCLEHDCLIVIVPMAATEWSSGGSAFHKNVQREGVLIA